jgi:hypothetical protein
MSGGCIADSSKLGRRRLLQDKGESMRSQTVLASGLVSLVDLRVCFVPLCPIDGETQGETRLGNSVFVDEISSNSAVLSSKAGVDTGKYQRGLSDP